MLIIKTALLPFNTIGYTQNTVELSKYHKQNKAKNKKSSKTSHTHTP